MTNSRFWLLGRPLLRLLSGVPLFALSFALMSPLYADDMTGSFTVRSIKYIGLHRVSPATAGNYMPVHVGDTMTATKAGKVIRALYRTGFFQSVSVAHSGQTLIIKVQELGTIGSVNVRGNRSISTEQLKTVLKRLDIVKGHVFHQATLDRFQFQLKQEYNQRGKYNASIQVRTTPLTQNRYAIVIDISEGRVARIKRIQFIGNHAYSTRRLIGLMSLRDKGFLTYFSKKDQYDGTKLAQSLQAIRDYYLDHGYLKFAVESSQVMLSEDRKSVYINIKVYEGPRYYFSGFDVKGKTIIAPKLLAAKVTIKAGEVFSRKQVNDAINGMAEVLGSHGYGFPNINAEPIIDEQNHQAFVRFMVMAGKHVYVRRIDFVGNTKTEDQVLRRVIKQDEGGLLSVSDVKESERQIRLLGYLKNIKQSIRPVVGTNNQVDVHFDVEEAPSAEASVAIGYGTNGPEFNAGFNQHNFMGTGRTIGFNFNTSYWGQNYSVNYYNPFYGDNGMGRGFDFFYQTVDPSRLDITAYTTDKFGFSVNYNQPIGDATSVQFGYGLEQLHITSMGSEPATQIQNFVNANGNKFNQLKLTAGIRDNRYDQQPFPTKGVNQQFGGMVALPLTEGELRYYKVSYQVHGYYPLRDSGFIVSALGNVSYGNRFDGLGLPFYENYFAGGIAQPGQVRGYESFSLGPIDSNGNSLGGNFLVNGTLALILPYPLSRETIRTSAFMDIGNVYSRGTPSNQRGSTSGRLRYSAGLALDWRSPFGPLTFSLATPINATGRDEISYFQFTLLSGF